MRRWLLALVPALLLLLLLLPGTTAYGAQQLAPAEGPQAQTFGIQPSGADQPDDRGAFSYAATPGAVVKDHVAVWNYGDQPLTLRLYPADAFNTDAGGYDVLPEGKPSTQAGTWLKAAADALTVPARSRQIVPFTLAVPADATPGDHPAGIVAALRQESKDAQGNAVTVDQRVGARVNIRVSGTLRAELTVESARVVHHPSLNPLDTGRTTVSYTVRNSGNVRLGGKQAVRVTNLLGSVATGQAPADLQELLPGNAVSYRVDVSGAYPAFLGTAGITIDPLPIGGDRDPGLTSTVHKQRYADIPWALLAVLLPLALGGTWWWRGRRRRARLAAARPVARPAAAPVGAALLLLALLTAAQFAGAPHAAAADTGTIAFDYPAGHDDDAIDLLTSGPCPDPAADYLSMRITGEGFPPEGAPLAGTVAATAYRQAAGGGYVLPLSNTLRVVANRSGAGALHGAYTITAVCRAKVNPAPLREFSGVLTFTTPTTWQTAAVAPEGVIHEAPLDPAKAAPAPGTASTPARGGEQTAAQQRASGLGAGSWAAIVGGLLLIGWVAVPPLRRRLTRGAAPKGAPAEAAEQPEPAEQPVPAEAAETDPAEAVPAAQGSAE
ncbi:hypothetical protein AB0D08_30440 [Kitasatospora sp. NPDC048540]|uniref:hypothetical protein n=1 Tax=Kitasatospora sp. NPDC048540 TaxID=3155634 RepID=UPI0033C541D6